MGDTGSDDSDSDDSDYSESSSEASESSEEESTEEEDSDEDFTQENADSMDEDLEAEGLDPQEIDDLLADTGRVNPNVGVHEDNDNEDDDVAGYPLGPENQEAGYPLGPAHLFPAGVSVSEGSHNSLRRSTRDKYKPIRLDPSPANVQVKKKVCFTEDYNLMAVEPENDIEYTVNIAGVAARHIHSVNEKAMANGTSLGQQYIVQKGLKLFGQKGREAAASEMGQLHNRECFHPIHVSDMSASEKSKAQEALMFLSEKKSGVVKGRTVYNGKPTREWHDKEDAASPTASLESIFLTAIIDAKEKRDVMSTDIPNAFIQATMPPLVEGEDRVMMKLKGILLELLVEQAPELYGPYVVIEDGKRILYLQVLRALYGMLVSALLWYQQFRRDLESKDFVFNPYDPCVANRWVGHQKHTVCFHVDDMKSSHPDPKVNDDFLVWLNKMYGEHGEVTATRGKVHDYLGMTFTYQDDGKVVISMEDYMSQLVDDFPLKIKKKAPTPAAKNLFTEGTSPTLDSSRSKIFHTWVAKALFACKRARPDIHLAVTYLCTRVKNPTEDDWTKLLRLLEYVNGTRGDVLTLASNDLQVLKWYVDASFAVHPDFKSHTGATFSYGTGAPMTMSRKQKLNTRSSTEAELVGADDASQLILWTKLFLEEQGYQVTDNILYQDNQSAILLEKNGRRSSSKRTRALNIRYFFLTDQVEKGNLSIQYCPTDEMIADFMTKPLQGQKFLYFKKLIMGS